MRRVECKSFLFMVVLLSIFVTTSCTLTDPASREKQVRLDRGWPKSNALPRRTTYPTLKVPLPGIPGAKYVNNDALCKVCHKTYAEAFEHNVHRKNNCESCHGPASKHLETRGNEPGTILVFDKLKKAERSEICAQCHEQDGCAPGAEWRTSAHAHQGVACTDCHVKNHYNVPEGSPPTAPDYASLNQIEDWALLVSQNLSDSLEEKKDDTDESDDRPSLRGTSNNLGAIVPVVCYTCHGDKYDLERIAHPHQVNGQHNFNCESCHNPHGNVTEFSRKDLCLDCHKSTPTMAWHSSIHDQVGVNCTDCHNPHPNANVQKQVNLSHTSVERPHRLPMSVDDPNVCYKCHQEVFALTQLPSHHPIREGKMTCADCHNSHGEAERNLKSDTVNLVCYRCHADKQGPFVYQHAPVEEDCSICHNPHGTVANNLLHQPVTFLCLRCHTGHRAPPSDHNFGLGAQGTTDIDGLPYQRAVLYTDCTQCHAQVHGSDLPSQLNPGSFLR